MAKHVTQREAPACCAVRLCRRKCCGGIFVVVLQIAVGKKCYHESSYFTGYLAVLPFFADWPRSILSLPQKLGVANEQHRAHLLEQSLIHDARAFYGTASASTTTQHDAVNRLRLQFANPAVLVSLASAWFEIRCVPAQMDSTTVDIIEEHDCSNKYTRC
jgi:hypothetical protein